MINGTGVGAIDKLEVARALLVPSLMDTIKSVDLLQEHFTLKILFHQGPTLYIRYNDCGEYSYQFLFSTEEAGFIRFDNFDDRWNVSTRPHA